MKAYHFIMFLSLFVFVLPGQAQRATQKQDEQKLMELSREWAKVAQSGDAERIVSYWSEDAILMTPDQGKLVAREQLANMVEGVKVPDASGKINTYYFVEVGIWEKQKNGAWKNTIDIYNPDPSLNSID